MKLLSTGSVDKLKKTWDVKRVFNLPDSSMETRPVALEQTGSLFVALMISCAVAIIILMFEKIFQKLKQTK